ncbi:hypothetical protein J2Z60_001450 [Lactobacillus colini]|uniref:Uncharacterized protein n=1 Tax=Lactobacillus colini TaxID=1819254 RepID=A0ABS4MF83_9LACO|nr:hypothetical protein [Lactobacillus colini]MBP2058273.1 hypothetical protein [Lactobacillus colini]
MKKDTYMNLLGFRDLCYNDFNFEVNVKNPFLGLDSYQKIEKILSDVQKEDSQLLTEFEAGNDIYQDYAPEFLSNTTKHEIKRDIEVAREFLDNYSGDAAKKKEKYQEFLEDNSLSYSFGPDSKLTKVEQAINNIDTNEVIVWQRSDKEYILLSHTVQSLKKIKSQIIEVGKIEDKQLRHSLERLFNNLNNFLKPFSENNLGKYEDNISQELRDQLMHFALDVQNDSREIAANKVAKFALDIAEKANNN